MTPGVANTLPALLHATAARIPNRPALVFGDRVLTYRELSGAVLAAGAGLRDMGVAPGQRVAILFPNCPQFVISYFGAQQAGATVVPLHCLQGPEETAHVLADSGAETLLALNSFEPLVSAIRPGLGGLRRVLMSGATTDPGLGDFEDLLQPPAVPPPAGPGSPEDVAALVYTSGTTGRPRGAMLTHDNLCFDARACCQAIDIHEQDVLGTVLPLFHSFGATVCMILPVVAGACSVLIPKFAPLAVAEALERGRVTVFAGVPSMYAVMLEMKTERRLDLSALRLAVVGGAPMPLEVLQGFEARYDLRIIEGYGPTEASPVVSVNPATGQRKVGTTGPAIPGVRISIRDEEFRELPVGEVGEVCVAGRNVMKGYWNDPERTAQAIRDGWLLTGDMGALDADGYLTIVDRKKDMVIVGGMNVYPREVEDVIYRLAGVLEVAVVGVPSRLRGEEVKAVVVPREGHELDARSVVDHCKAHLANYKVPRLVEFRTGLPKSATGKVLKRELR